MARLFSGIRPSGDLHLGNYLGAIKQWVEIQKQHEAIFAVVDYHAITTPFEPKKLKKLTYQTLAWYLAAGLDHRKVTTIRQSDIPEHTELAWLFNAITPLADLERMTQFKEKAAEQRGGVTAGLLNYPVLMAADILLYGAELVPVGADQVQHIELAREIGRRFNSRFGKLFVEPKPLLTKVPKIMSLTNPDQKMSKTGASGIALSDPPSAIRQKVMAAVTDTKPQPPIMSAGVANLFGILTLVAPEEAGKLKKKYDAGTLRYLELKETVASAIIDELAPMQTEFKKISTNPELVWSVFAEGAQKARPQAQATLGKAKALMGF